MKILKRVVVGLILLGGLVCLVSLFLPEKVHLERTITVNAPAAQIFPHVNNLRVWNEWSPWYAMEPTAVYSYGELSEGAGAKMSWTGDKVGTGSQTITVSNPYENISSSLEFGQGPPATADFIFLPEGDGTKVTWRFDTELGMNPISRFFGVLLPGMLGPQYEEGLNNLKRVVEAEMSADHAPGAEQTGLGDLPTSIESPTGR